MLNREQIISYASRISSFFSKFSLNIDKKFNHISAPADETIHLGYVAYIPDNRLARFPYDVWCAEDREKHAIKIKVGKLLSKSVPDIRPETISEIVQQFLMEFKTEERPYGDYEFIVNDNFLKYSLHYYPPENSSTLWGSCMRYTNLAEDIDKFYRNLIPGKIRLITCEKDNKVYGRALLWKDADLLDRIYSYSENICSLFKEWAKKNGYNYKRYQTYDCDEYVPVHGSNYGTIGKLEIKFPPKWFDKIPYLDTFRYLNLSVDEESRTVSYFLYLDSIRDTDGDDQYHYLRFRNTDMRADHTNVYFDKYHGVFVPTEYFLWENTLYKNSEGEYNAHIKHWIPSNIDLIETPDGKFPVILCVQDFLGVWRNRQSVTEINGTIVPWSSVRNFKGIKWSILMDEYIGPIYNETPLWAIQN